METEMIKVPFDVELAKKITNGECEGRIVTRDGRNVQFATRFNIDIIKENNEGFAHWYNAAMEDSQSIIRV